MTPKKQMWWKLPDGKVKLIDLDDFNKMLLELPDYNTNQEVPKIIANFEKSQNSSGLGDVIAAATKAVGIKPCNKCKQRQKKLNQSTPSWIKKFISKIQYWFTKNKKCNQCNNRKKQYEENKKILEKIKTNQINQNIK